MLHRFHAVVVIGAAGKIPLNRFQKRLCAAIVFFPDAEKKLRIVPEKIGIGTAVRVLQCLFADIGKRMDFSFQLPVPLLTEIRDLNGFPVGI